MSRLSVLRRLAVEMSATIGVFRLVRDFRPGLVSVLTYHGFIDDERRTRGRFGYLFRYSLSIRRLRAQLAFLRRTARILDPEEFLAIVDGDPAPPHGVLITIDDAWRSVFDLALPVFAACKVRPVLMVPTGAVTSASAGLPSAQWHEALAALVLADDMAIRRAWRELCESLPSLPVAPSDSPTSLLQDLTRVAWSLSAEARRDLLTLVRGLTGRDPDRDELRYSDGPGTALDVMTWDELRAAVRMGAEVGSHTVSHPKLAALSEPDLEWELWASAREIREQLGRPSPFFAVPYGHAADCHPQQESVLARAGYHVAFTQEGGPWLPPLRPLRLPRRGIPAGCSVGQLDSYLSGLQSVVERVA